MTADGKVKRARRTNKEEAIIDAAERIFSRKGYFATSMRDIARAAEVNLGLLNYYFKTKEELFRRVVQRRRDDLYGLIRASLDEAERAAELHSPSPKAVIRAFIGPFLKVCVHDDGGLRDYVRLTSQFMTAYREPELHDALASLDPITQLFVGKMRALFPYMEEECFYAALYAIEASLIFMVQDPGFVDELSRGYHRAANLDRLIDYLVPFFAGGMHALSELQPVGPAAD